MVSASRAATCAERSAAAPIENVTTWEEQGQRPRVQAGCKFTSRQGAVAGRPCAARQCRQLHSLRLGSARLECPSTGNANVDATPCLLLSHGWPSRK